MLRGPLLHPLQRLEDRAGTLRQDPLQVALLCRPPRGVSGVPHPCGAGPHTEEHVGRPGLRGHCCGRVGDLRLRQGAREGQVDAAVGSSAASSMRACTAAGAIP